MIVWISMKKGSTRRNKKSSNHQLSPVFVLVLSSQQDLLEHTSTVHHHFTSCDFLAHAEMGSLLLKVKKSFLAQCKYQEAYKSICSEY